MTLHPALVFLGGLVVLVLGAEMVLRGAARIAGLLRIPPIVIGLTIVSVGTSTPELAVGIAAVNEGRDALAVGNIAGTNLFNILVILGASALIRPLPMRLLSIRLDVPVMILTALGLIAMSADGLLARAEGAVMLAVAAVYTVALVWLSRLESAAMRREFAEEYGAAVSMPRPGLGLPATPAGIGAWNGVLLVAGMTLTVLGAELLVSSASTIARLYGVSDALIGLTIVAVGTSAPELATTLVATIRDDRDVAIGNLLGSSIFNVLVILGLTCVAAPGGLDVSRDILWIDLPLAALVAIVCLPVFRSERRVSRVEGGMFVGTYLLYFAALLTMRT